ncbi:MAG: carbohydrate kinase family protein [Candidatus Lokiarchaeota archaeon]|nr:carbohydrate kinase family protein [Candidatus Lokiarchaeota archaeon]
MNNKILILGLGEIVKDWVSIIPWFPKPDEKIDSIYEEYFGGGVTANYVVSTSRLGVPSAFIGAVGDDDAGEFLIRDMKNEGVNTNYLTMQKEKKSAVNFIFVIKDTGEKTIIQSPYMQSTKLSPEDLNIDMFKSPKVLHTTCIHPDVTLEAMKLAKEEGLVISLDLESQIAIRGLKALKPFLNFVDVLLPNKMGAMALTKKNSPIEAAKEFINMGISCVVITLGDKGAIGLTKEDTFESPAFKVQAVDATGAGDTFCGGFTFAYIIKKWTLQKSLIFANACAAMKMTQLGARTGMPTLNKVISFLHGRGYSNFLSTQ